MNKFNFDNQKILVLKKDYVKAMRFFESKGYFFSDFERFLKFANEKNQVFFISHYSLETKRIFLCEIAKNCEVCEVCNKIYTPYCKELEIISFDDREKKLRKILDV